MQSFSKAEVRAALTRLEQPTRKPDEVIHVFVHGRLKNPLNDSTLKHFGVARARYMSDWKDKVANVLLGTGWMERRAQWPADEPKVVTFMARTHGRYDTDGLQSALKGVRDALTQAGVISGDGPGDGHTFVYEQQIDRTHRGVEIVVRCRPIQPDGSEADR